MATNDGRVVMKMYTNESQTAKLIELGFEKPKNRLVKQRFDRSTSSWIVVGEEGDYSIGELIEMLPEALAPLSDPDNEMMLNVSTDSLMWAVRYSEGEFTPYETISCELIDALYAMILQLKEEGVI